MTVVGVCSAALNDRARRALTRPTRHNGGPRTPLLLRDRNGSDIAWHTPPAYSAQPTPSWILWLICVLELDDEEHWGEINSTDHP